MGATQNSDDGPQLEERGTLLLRSTYPGRRRRGCHGRQHEQAHLSRWGRCAKLLCADLREGCWHEEPEGMVEDAGKVGSGAPGGAAPAAGSGSAPAAAAKKESSSESEGAGMAGGGLFGEEEAW